MCHFKSIDNKRSVINPAIPRFIPPRSSPSPAPQRQPPRTLSYFPGVYYYFYIYFHITCVYCRCKMASQLSQLYLLSTHSSLTFFKNASFIICLILVFPGAALGLLCFSLSILAPEPTILMTVAYEYICNILEWKQTISLCLCDITFLFF